MIEWWYPVFRTLKSDIDFEGEDESVYVDLLNILSQKLKSFKSIPMIIRLQAKLFSLLDQNNDEDDYSKLSVEE